jgi:hypothetical protein
MSTSKGPADSPDGRRRASLFDPAGTGEVPLDDLVLDDLIVPARTKQPPPPKEAVKQVAASAGFVSRDPHPSISDSASGQLASKPAAMPSSILDRAPPSRPRTRRVFQVNFKAAPETLQLLTSLEEKTDWDRALIFERALAALDRLLEEGVSPKSLDVGPR